MFSPICQQSFSTQVPGSRERKSFYHALRWMAGQRQCWSACGSGSMSRHAGAIPPATATLMLLFPPCLLLTEISFCIQCSAVEQVRFHVSWQYLVMSQRDSYFPRKPPHVSLKCIAELASPILCLCHQESVIIFLFPHTLSRLRRSQKAVGLPSPSSPGQLASLACFNNTLDALSHTVEKFCEKWKSMISLNYGLQWQDGGNEAVFSIYIVLCGDSEALPRLGWIMSH